MFSLFPIFLHELNITSIPKAEVLTDSLDISCGRKCSYGRLWNGTAISRITSALICYFIFRVNKCWAAKWRSAMLQTILKNRILFVSCLAFVWALILVVPYIGRRFRETSVKYVFITYIFVVIFVIATKVTSKVDDKEIRAMSLASLWHICRYLLTNILILVYTSSFE